MTEPSPPAPAASQRWLSRVFRLVNARVSSASAQLVGWGALALVNAILLALGRPRLSHFGLRLEHLYYDSAQLTSIGLVGCGLSIVWRRWGPERRLWTQLATWGLAAIVGAVVLPEDVAVLCDKLAVWGPTVIYVVLLVALVSAGIPVASLIGSWLKDRALALLGVGIGVGAAAGNHFFVPNDYPGMHLFIAWGAATLIGSSIADPRLPAPAGRRTFGLYLGFALACVWSLVITPNNAVRLSLSQSASSVVAPWIARWRPPNEDYPTLLVGFSREWFDSRATHAAIPPSNLALLPRDGIVIVMVMDATRADLWTNPQTAPQLPVLTRFASQSVRFSLARTPAPSTTQAVTSLMCGRYYSELYWTNKPGHDRQAMYPHMDDSVRYPQLLTRAGIDTVQIVGLPGLLDSFGISRGFKEETSVPASGGDFAGAKTMLPKAIERLRRQGKGRLYMHFQVVDPHAPYNRGGTRGTAFDRYVAEVAVVDTAFGQLLDAVRDLGLEDRTIIFVTADHGEAFSEHGHKYHATAVYEEMIRIPLMVRVPHIAPRVVDEPVSLLDLGPTILDMFGIPTPGASMGQSLVPLIAGGNQHLERPIIADSSRLMRAIYTREGMKLIENRRRNTTELYDLKLDPGEHDNLVTEQPDRALELLGALHAFFHAHELRREGYKTPYGR